MHGELMLVGEVAKRLGLSPVSVRGLESRGELVPTARTATGVRLYDQADVEAVAARRAADRGDRRDAGR